MSRGWDWLSQSKYLTNTNILICPSDPYNGIASKRETCFGRTLEKKTSYYSPFSPVGLLWGLLTRIDNNPGILACRVHGDYSDRVKTIR